ncbi:hypothetical protein DRN58_05145 [Thermococci archaeon]|nr:MAG: hypothetical protein DRN58_05145 [Thermococci archaeon]
MKGKIKRKHPAFWLIRHRSGNIRDHPQRYHINVGKRYLSGNFRKNDEYNRTDMINERKNTSKDITEKDIKDLIDFERRLEKKLGVHDPIDKERYYMVLFRNYVSGKSRYPPPNINREKWYKLNEDEQKKVTKNYYYGILKRKMNEAQELSEIHNVPFKVGV